MGVTINSTHPGKRISQVRPQRSELVVLRGARSAKVCSAVFAENRRAWREQARVGACQWLYCSGRGPRP